MGIMAARRRSSWSLNLQHQLQVATILAALWGRSQRKHLELQSLSSIDGRDLPRSYAVLTTIEAHNLLTRGCVAWLLRCNRQTA